MRDHRKLRAFEKADLPVLEVYRLTQSFARAEAFGLTIQMRRAAVSIACNIVEGCARRSQRDLLKFVDIALGSAKELAYQLTVARRLQYGGTSIDAISVLCDETVRMLGGSRRAVERIGDGSSS